jgi:hypothetical protein
MLLSFSTYSQKKERKEKKEISSKYFDIIVPNENNRADQFLTAYLRTHKRLNLSRDIKKMLTNPNRYSDSQNTLRGPKQFGNGTTSLTKIYLDDVKILGEGINRLFVIENIRTNEVEKITRNKVGYDKEIKIYTKEKS